PTRCLRECGVIGRHPDNVAYTVMAKALFFDVFGTMVDWYRGVAREAERVLAPRGVKLDWLEFSKAWRAQYQPGMEEVRSGQMPFARLDVIHRRMLARIQE